MSRIMLSIFLKGISKCSKFYFWDWKYKKEILHFCLSSSKHFANLSKIYFWKWKYKNKLSAIKDVTLNYAPNLFGKDCCFYLRLLWFICSWLSCKLPFFRVELKCTLSWDQNLLNSRCSILGLYVVVNQCHLVCNFNVHCMKHDCFYSYASLSTLLCWQQIGNTMSSINWSCDTFCTNIYFTFY
jgi:hypothetical protein